MFRRPYRPHHHHHRPHHHPPRPPHPHPPRPPHPHPPRPPIPGRTQEECCISSDMWNGALDQSCAVYQTDSSCNQLAGYCKWRDSPYCPETSVVPQPFGPMGGPEIHKCLDGTEFVCQGGSEGCSFNNPKYCPTIVPQPFGPMGGLETHKCLNGTEFVCQGGSEGCSFNNPKYCAPVVPQPNLPNEAYFCVHQPPEGQLECISMPNPEGVSPQGDNSTGFTTIEDCYEGTSCEPPLIERFATPCGQPGASCVDGPPPGGNCWGC